MRSVLANVAIDGQDLRKQRLPYGPPWPFGRIAHRENCRNKYGASNVSSTSGFVSPCWRIRSTSGTSNPVMLTSKPKSTVRRCCSSIARIESFSQYRRRTGDAYRVPRSICLGWFISFLRLSSPVSLLLLWLPFSLPFVYSPY
jgi:hypothetical protein